MSQNKLNRSQRMEILNMIKEGYFQGTEEPTPHKRKYKAETAIVDQPRFKTPFFSNYDYAGESSDISPGAGLYQHMNEYKSVGDFIKKKREKSKAKYKSDDDYKHDDGSITKTREKAAMERDICEMLKLAIDFPLDDQIKDPIMIENTGSSYSDSVPFSFTSYETLPLNDSADKRPDQLNYGNDIDDEEVADASLEELIEKYLNPAEGELFGIPGGISPIDNLDPEATITSQPAGYGTTDFGNLTYENGYY